MELSSQVFLLLAAFKRKAARGVSISKDELHHDVVQIFRKWDHAAERESSSKDIWDLAKKALVYHVDETMTAAQWEDRAWWEDNALEAKLLNNPQKMRGILFFDELEKAKNLFETSTTAGSARDNYLADLLTVFYCCLRFGFEGKFVGQPQELQREAERLLAMLPPGSGKDSRVYFDQAYQHTIEVPPNYTPAMRMVTILAIVVFAAVLCVGFRSVLWNELLADLSTVAEQVGGYFAG